MKAEQRHPFGLFFSDFQKKFVIYYMLGLLGTVILFVGSASWTDRRAVDRHEQMFNQQQSLQTFLAKQAMDDHISRIFKETKMSEVYFLSEFFRGKQDRASLDELFRIRLDAYPDVLGYICIDLPQQRVIHARTLETATGAEVKKLYQGWTEKYLSKWSSADQDIFVTPFHLTENDQIAGIFFPVRTEGSVSGALLVIADLQPMITRYVAPMRSGNYGAGYLIDERGNVVYDHETEIIGTNVFDLHTKYPDLIRVDKLLISEPSGMDEYEFTVKRGGKVSRKLIAWHSVRIGTRKIVIALSAPDIEIDEALSDMRFQRILMGGFLALIIVMMSFFFFYKMAQESIQRIRTEAETRAKLLAQEMELARRIQTVLLPKKPEITGYEIAASCEPCEQVGGDYYDVISSDGYDWIVIGDVSGHGLTAGLIMMMVQTAIHTVINENPEVSPSHLLSVINQSIYANIERMDESKHMTIIVLASGKNGKFSFSGLHEDIMIRRAETGKVETVESDGMWIGLEPDISEFLSDETFHLQPGDCMVLFTDGITEAQGRGNSLFGDERLIRLIEESGDRPASEVHRNIITALEPWEKPDDVTLVVVKRTELATDVSGVSNSNL